MTEVHPATRLRVALMEDEEDLREEIVFSLNELGFDAAGYGSASAFYGAQAEYSVDIAIIDVGLPGEDGFSILAQLRATSMAGVVMLTARGTLEDRIRGLRQGADVYLVKPVLVQELAAVLQSLGRRLQPPTVESLTVSSSDLPSPVSPLPNTPNAQIELVQNGWVLKRRGHDARLVLSVMERAVLLCLFAHQDEEVTRNMLIEALAGDTDADFDPHRVDVLVSRLRQKARSAGIPVMIKSVRNVGYVLVG